MKMIAIRISIFLGLLTIASPSLAAPKCNVQTTSVAFGAYDTLDPTRLDGVGTIHVTCNTSTTFTAGLGNGTGTINQRLMSSGPSTLRYNLYKDASRTIIWGDGALNGVSSTSSNGSLTVYGAIPAQQAVPAGDYMDTIIVTIIY